MSHKYIVLFLKWISNWLIDQFQNKDYFCILGFWCYTWIYNWIWQSKSDQISEAKLIQEQLWRHRHTSGTGRKSITPRRKPKWQAALSEHLKALVKGKDKIPASSVLQGTVRDICRQQEFLVDSSHARSLQQGPEHRQENCQEESGFLEDQQGRNLGL